MSLDRLRVTLFALLAVVLVGYLGLRPIAAAIDVRYAQLATLQAQLRTRVDLERRRAALDGEARVLRGELAGFHLHESRAQLIARFLRVLTPAAAFNHVRIDKVVAPSPTAPTGPTAGLERVPLDLSVHGAYADVLTLMRAWSGFGFALNVGVGSLVSERSAATPTRPQLNAVLHVLLLRDNDGPRASIPRRT
jgi:hypothetical protein